eukprot:m.25596 g.25596  ORF g.25596 m.25596 type:complete len:815 (-) comp9786_c0_seq1:247-2691(-)
MAEGGAFLGHPTFDAFSKSLVVALVTATRASNDLPKDANYSYFHQVAPAFRQRMGKASSRLLDKIQALIAREQGAKHADRTDVNDDEHMEDIIAACNTLLNRVDDTIDQIERDELASQQTGMTTSIPTSSVVALGNSGVDGGNNNTDNSNSSNNAAWSQTDSGNKRVRLLHAKNIRPPQLDFVEKVDNSEAIFVPKLKEKLNAMVPYDQTKRTIDTAYGRIEYYPHPYEHEITHFEYQDSQLQATPERMFASLNTGDCHWVETEEALQALKLKLEDSTEFAIDLEAHNYRSYQGFVCLMQISTRTEDFLIDTLALRHHMHILNSSFSNPDILKVLHGADSDIIWLQRDFGLYIVNMFDTGQAMRVLQYPRFSLAYAMKFFCDVTANKAYQLADWRVRPLSLEMMQYAREDTHYLLYIYDKLRNELLAKGNEQKNLLMVALQKSRELCLLRYDKPVYSDALAMDLYHKYSHKLTPSQLVVFKALHAWRDRIAREEDESLRYVMPDLMLFELAEVGPREFSQVLACCRPTPPLVRHYVHNILEVILAAKQEPVPEAITSLKQGTSSKMSYQQETEDLSHLELDQSVYDNSITPDELYDSAAWVADPASVSQVADMFCESDDEEIDMAENAAKLAGVNAALCQSSLFRSNGSADFLRNTSSDITIGQVSSSEVKGEPASYAEIYRLSNLNRKRNKEKKKLKEEQATGGRDDDEAEAASPVQTGDPEEYMASLGWVPRADKPARGPAPSQVAPYDYSAASSDVLGASVVRRGSQQQQQPEARKSFAPYKDNERSGSNAPRSKVMQKTGQRSITFNTRP